MAGVKSKEYWQWTLKFEGAITTTLHYIALYAYQFLLSINVKVFFLHYSNQ